jgi:hypothetical protein
MCLACFHVHHAISYEEGVYHTQSFYLLQLPNAFVSASVKPGNRNPIWSALPLETSVTQRWFGSSELENIPWTAFVNSPPSATAPNPMSANRVDLAADQASSAQNASSNSSRAASTNYHHPPPTRWLASYTALTVPANPPRCPADLEVTVLSPELDQDVTTLLNFSQNSATVSYSELVTGRQIQRPPGPNSF